MCRRGRRITNVVRGMKANLRAKTDAVPAVLFQLDIAERPDHVCSSVGSVHRNRAPQLIPGGACTYRQSRNAIWYVWQAAVPRVRIFLDEEAFQLHGVSRASFLQIRLLAFRNKEFHSLLFHRVQVDLKG